MRQGGQLQSSLTSYTSQIVDYAGIAIIYNMYFLTLKQSPYLLRSYTMFITPNSQDNQIQPPIMGGYVVSNHGAYVIVTMDSRSNVGNCKPNKDSGEVKSFNHCGFKMLQLTNDTGTHWLMVQFGQTHLNHEKYLAFQKNLKAFGV